MQATTVRLDLPVKIECPAKRGALIDKPRAPQIRVFQRDMKVQRSLGGIPRVERPGLAFHLNCSAARDRSGESDWHGGGGRNVAGQQMDILVRTLRACGIAAAMADVYGAIDDLKLVHGNLRWMAAGRSARLRHGGAAQGGVVPLAGGVFQQRDLRLLHRDGSYFQLLGEDQRYQFQSDLDGRCLEELPLAKGRI